MRDLIDTESDLVGILTANGMSEREADLTVAASTEALCADRLANPARMTAVSPPNAGRLRKLLDALAVLWAADR